MLDKSQSFAANWFIKVLKGIIRIFFFFVSKLQKKKMSTETYGDFRVEFLHDEGCEKLWVNDLFWIYTIFGASVDSDIYLKTAKQKICY